jgi:hypothetical protein
VQAGPHHRQIDHDGALDSRVFSAPSFARGLKQLDLKAKSKPAVVPAGLALRGLSRAYSNPFSLAARSQNAILLSLG